MFLAAIIVILLTLSFLLQGQLHPDVLYFLYQMEHVISGKRLIIDIIDINTPLIYYFNIPAVYISRIFNLSLESSLIIFTYLLIILSFLIYVRFLNLIFPKSKKVQIFLLTGAVLPLLFSGDSFIQRDFLIVMFFFGYFLSRTYSSTLHEKSLILLRILTGLLLGFTIFFKPSYLMVFLLYELIIFIKVHNLKKYLGFDVLGLLGGAFISLIIIFYCTPDYFRYISLGLLTYPKFTTLYPLVRINEILIIGLLSACFMLIQRRGKNDTIKNYLFVFMILCYIGGVMQNKGFEQHFFPFRFSSSILFSYFAFLGLSGSQQNDLNKGWFKECYIKSFNNHTLTCIMLLFSFLFIFLFNIALPILRSKFPDQSINSQEYQNLQALVSKKALGKNIAALSTKQYPFSLLDHECNTKWSIRYPNFWLLPGFYNNLKDASEKSIHHSIGEMNFWEKEFFDNVITDLIKHKPVLLFVDTDYYKKGFGKASFNYIDYFSQDVRFQELINDYLKTSKVFGFDVYERIS